jgi:hypothetical protein
MKTRRFDHLESQKDPGLPASVLTALSRIERFDHLEIGEIHTRPAVPMDRILCSHCGQYNETVRTHCWACYRWVGKNAPPPAPPGADLELILDGKSYRSQDPKLPEDVRVLMGWIQREGYSTDLIAKWRQWRATRNRANPGGQEEGVPPTSPPSEDIKVFRGQRVSVITINGKMYSSLDKNNPPDLKALFDYLADNEVTPALMDHLRTYGTKVKYRPPTTLDPTDGDVSFWGKISELLNPYYPG